MKRQEKSASPMDTVASRRRPRGNVAIPCYEERGGGLNPLVLSLSLSLSLTEMLIRGNFVGKHGDCSPGRERSRLRHTAHSEK